MGHCAMVLTDVNGNGLLHNNGASWDDTDRCN